jgi:hypothetical protein
MHQSFTQAASASQLLPLPAANDNVKHVPQLRVSSCGRQTTTHGLQALHADAGGQTVQGMRQNLGHKRAARVRN